MDLQVDVEGLSELQTALEEAGPKLARRAYPKAMRAATKPFVAAAKRRAPVMAVGTKRRRPGELRDSIKGTVKSTKGGVRGKVGPARNKGEDQQSPGTWGLMVEFGSIHNKPMPYLRPAFDESNKDAVEAFADVLRDEVKKVNE